MGVGEDHLELVSNSHSLDHVADSATDSSKNSVTLLFLEPHAELKGVGFGLFVGLLADLDGDVFEPAGEGAQLALDHDLTGLDVNGDSFGDFQLLLCYDVLHGIIIGIINNK